MPTLQAYQEYVSWWHARKLEWVPPPPKLGIFVAHAEYGLVTGAHVVTTDGVFVMLEHFSVNPKNRWLWKEAAHRTLSEFRRVSVMLGKIPVIAPDRKSLAKVCLENGFSYSGARSMVAPLVSG